MWYDTLEKHQQNIEKLSGHFITKNVKLPHDSVTEFYMKEISQMIRETQVY